MRYTCAVIGAKFCAIRSIPFLLEAAAVLATFVHPNHIVCLCSWGFTHVPPTCNFTLFGYIQYGTTRIVITGWAIDLRAKTYLRRARLHPARLFFIHCCCGGRFKRKALFFHSYYVLRIYFKWIKHTYFRRHDF